MLVPRCMLMVRIFVMVKAARRFNLPAETLKTVSGSAVLPAGVYFVHLKAGGSVAVRKVVVLE